MLEFKMFSRARILLTGIELMHMIHKGQMKHYKLERTPAQLFHSLVAYPTPTSALPRMAVVEEGQVALTRGAMQQVPRGQFCSIGERIG